MLGRTDSRFRALLVLVAFVLVAGSLGVRLAYWQVVRRDELAAMARQQSSLRYEIPTNRGSIYDRTGTVVLATSVSRDRLAAYPKHLTPRAARGGGREAGRHPRPRRGRRDDPAHQDDLGAGVPGAGPRPRARGLRPHPGAELGRQAGAHRPGPGARAGAGLPAGRRRPGHHAGRPRPRLREPRGRGPVRRRAVLPGRAGRHATRGGRPARRRRQPRPGHARPCWRRAFPART